MTGRRAMSSWHIILVLQSFLTYVLTGLAWNMQLVHYPLFSYVDRDRFCDFLKKHQKRSSYIMVPFMVLECFLSILTLVVAPAGMGRIAAYTLLALVLVIWFSTFCFQVPEHSTLNKGFCHKSLKKLVATNWIRTAAWTLRSILLVLLLLKW
jgi:hypothetical protein